MQTAGRVRHDAVAKVAAIGTIAACPETVAVLRKNPGEWSVGPESPATIIKLADEQAVLATVALLQAIDRAGWRDRSFATWGVIAAPRFLSRMRGTAAISRYRRLGPRAMSPLIIPTLSLHSISGAVSLILQSHGPNFGIGGDQANLPEALMGGLTLLETNGLPGVWVIITGWEPEPFPDDNGRSTTPTIGYGIAMALVDVATAEPGLLLRYDPDATDDPPQPPSLHDFATAIADPDRPEIWHTCMEGGGVLRLLRPAAMSGRAA